VLVYQTLGQSPDLATCANNPTQCDAQQLATILDALECGCPPDATVIPLLGKGMAAGDSSFGTNPFFANAGVMRAMRANAPANPDVAIVTVVKAIDDLFQNGSNDTLQTADITDTSGQFTNGFFAEAINVLRDSIPKAQADQQARGILKLKDLTGITSLANIGNNARAALSQIQLPTPTPTPTPTPAPTPTSPASGISPNVKIAVVVVMGAAILGAGAFAVWRLSAHPGRMAPAMGRRRRVR